VAFAHLLEVGIGQEDVYGFDAFVFEDFVHDVFLFGVDDFFPVLDRHTAQLIFLQA